MHGHDRPDDEVRDALSASEYLKHALAGQPPYVIPIERFLNDTEPPEEVIFPALLPRRVILLIHGEPRARKSFVALELALAASSGTAPFGLARFQPAGAVRTLYVQEEDDRIHTRRRLRPLVMARGGVTACAHLSVAVRAGINLDDPEWVDRLVGDLRRLEIAFLVLDPARRLSARTDEGPTKMRELTKVLRRLVLDAGVTIAIVHHDIKPPMGEDPRRRGHRASGGDWFAAGDCPLHVERIDKDTTLVYPQDYKLGDDPAPFTMRLVVEDGLVIRLEGKDQTTTEAEQAGVRGKLLEHLRTHGPATQYQLRKAGFPRLQLPVLLDALVRDGLLDQAPGRKANSIAYVAVQNRTGRRDPFSDEPDWIESP